MRMRGAAIFRARAAEDARSRRLERQARDCGPGIMSILPASDGTQNEWMTSGLASFTSIRWPTGRRTSFAVSICPAGVRYSTRHHHCLAVT